MAQKFKQNLIKKLKNTYCRIKPSKIGGVGVFAIRNIPKGTDPFLYSQKVKWIKLKKADIEKLDISIQRLVQDFYVYDKGYYYVSYNGLNSNDISFFVNHSKKPNLETDDGSFFKTMRVIKTGEELLADYNTYEPDGAIGKN